MAAFDPELVVRPAHLQLALHISDRTLIHFIRRGDIPRPDGYSTFGLKLWRLETIRAWNPDVAAEIERLLAIPAFAPRPEQRYKPRRLQAT